MKCFKLIILVVTIVLVSCGITVKKEFNTKEDLVKQTIHLLNKGNSQALRDSLITKDYFIKEIYGYTKSGKQKNGLSGDDFWRTFIANRRTNAIQNKIRNYKGKILKVISVNDAKDIIDNGPYKMHRRVSISLMVNDNGKKITVKDDDIIGVMIEKDGKYRLLNIFKD